MVSLELSRIRPRSSGRDAVSRLHCWPSNDVPKAPVRRADAQPHRPVRLPRRGRQSICWPGGFESWVADDNDLEAAWGITPARFLFERALAQLVELPSLWTSIPLHKRDADELLPEIEAIVDEHALPPPHLVVAGQGRVVVLWHIRPLHYPAALKASATPEEKSRHEQQTFAFRRCLRDWKRAAVKLRLAFAPLGAEPHTPATVDGQLLEHIPFPLDPSHPAARIRDLTDDPPALWSQSDHEPVLIKDVSVALAAYDQAMWATFKEARPRRGSATTWMESEATKAALAITDEGNRHQAAVTIVCACVWDGYSEEQALQVLRGWAARCSDDGRFPWRRNSGDELEHLVRWGLKRLSPGGPTPRDGSHRQRITAFDKAAAAVLAWVASESGPDGLVAVTQPELRREASLLSSTISRTTFKRVLHSLKEQGLLEQEVIRVGRTWCSRFRLVAEAVAKVGNADMGQMSISQVQKEESLWAPAPASWNNGGGLGDASPSGRGVRGEGHVHPEDAAPESPADHEHHLLPEAQKPKNDPIQNHSQTQSRRRQRNPRLLALPFEGTAEARHRRRRRAEEVPPLTDAVFLELKNTLIDATVRPHRLAAGLPDALDDEAARAVLLQAHAALRPRPSLKERFAESLRRQAQRILRLEAFAEVSRQTAEARRRRDQARELEQAQAQSQAPSTTNPFAAIYAAQSKPLHELHPKERARRLVAHELSLVVLAPRAKEPPPGSSWTAAQVMRTRLPVLERQLEAQGDEAGLAIVCGPVSGIVAVDLDDAEAVVWAQKHLPTTPWRTKTGRGEHWFYRLPDGWEPPTTLPYKGQLQAAGRYVVAPGSIHPQTGGQYEAVGDWQQPKQALPEFRNEWLLDAEELRRRRQEVLKSTT